MGIWQFVFWAKSILCARIWVQVPVCFLTCWKNISSNSMRHVIMWYLRYRYTGAHFGQYNPITRVDGDKELCDYVSKEYPSISVSTVSYGDMSAYSCHNHCIIMYMCLECLSTFFTLFFLPIINWKWHPFENSLVIDDFGISTISEAVIK